MKFGNNNDSGNFQLNPKLRSNFKNILLFVILFGIIIATVFNYVLYRETIKTVTVVQTKGDVKRGQPIYYNESNPKDEQNNIQPYEMTYNEFIRYSYRNTSIGISSRIVEWKNRNSIISRGDIVRYWSNTIDNERIVFSSDVIKDKVDNSRLLLSIYPGKVKALLDIQSTDVLAFKKILEVGDKINIDCTFNENYQTIVGVRNQSGNQVGKTNLDIDYVKVETVFNGIQIADILNSEGNSVLDYITEFNQLPVNMKMQIEGSADYQKATKAQKILVALTPDQYQRYLQYKSKSNAKFWVSIP